MFTHVRHRIAEEYSSANAFELTAGIQRHDRWSTFDQYRRSGEYCAARMREYGLEGVEQMAIPADGATRIGDWVMPLAWDVENAVLRVVEPRASGGRILAHYREEPASLAMWSAPTPPGGVDVEVVYLEDGSREEEYARVDVRGKAVFTHRSHGSVRGLAARRGAVGLITDYPACKDDALANATCWMNAWVDHHGWGFLKTDTPMWGFSLTRDKGQYLERLMASGETVRVRADVASCLYEGDFTLSTGVIRGESDDEVLAYAHAYEYGAEDNAAGCATVLEAARTLQHLIQDGALPRPKRTIRFMMSWECYGSIAWAVRRIHGRRNVVAGLCLDDLGGKQSLTGGAIKLILNPHCQASYTDYLAKELAAACFGPEHGLAYAFTRWSGGTDHTVFEDPQFGVPMPWLTEHPARYHHTSLDEMDKIDRRSLGVEGVFAATYLYALANAGEPEARWLSEGTRTLWEEDLVSVAMGARERVGAAASPVEVNALWQEADERLEYLLARGREAIQSLMRLSGAPGVRAAAVEGAVVQQVGALERAASQQIEQLRVAAGRRAEALGGSLVTARQARPLRQGAERVPRRKVPGLLTLCGIPDAERAELGRVTHGASPMWSPVLTFGLYWADGTLPIGEIQHRVELECGPTEIDLVEYFQFLERLGYVEWA
mgnify:CR=1 FL=1